MRSSARAATDRVLAVFAAGRAFVGRLWYNASLPRKRALLLLAVLTAFAGVLLLAAPPTTVHPTTSGNSSHGVGSKTPPEGQGPSVTPGPASSSERLSQRDECISQPLPVITLSRAGNRAGSVELVIGAVAVCVGVFDVP